MAKLVKKHRTNKVDFGDGQIITFKRLTPLEVFTIVGDKFAETINQRMKQTLDLIIESGIDWEGITDENGKPVPFSKEELYEVIYSLEGVELQVALEKILKVILPKNEEEDVKNSETTSSE